MTASARCNSKPQPREDCDATLCGAGAGHNAERARCHFGGASRRLSVAADPADYWLPTTGSAARHCRPRGRRSHEPDARTAGRGRGRPRCWLKTSRPSSSHALRRTATRSISAIQLTSLWRSAPVCIQFVNDFTPITLLTGLPLILAVPPSLGVSSVKEFIALAKSKPGELTYASVGHGTVPHLSTELLALRAGIKLVHVPYQGSPPALTDLLAARVSIMLGQAVRSCRMFEVGQADRLRLGLGHASADRPQHADYRRSPRAAWYDQHMVRVGCACRSAALGDRQAQHRGQRCSQVRRRGGQTLRKAKFEPLGGASDQFAKFIAAQTVEWNEAIKAAEQLK